MRGRPAGRRELSLTLSQSFDVRARTAARPTAALARFAPRRDRTAPADRSNRPGANCHYNLVSFCHVQVKQGYCAG